MSKNYCSICFAKLIGEDCKECNEENSVEEIKTGKKPKDKNKFKPKDSEVWIEVKSPYKKFKDGIQ